MNTLKPFVIYSFPRSGTHMTKSALDSHPQLTCHGEVFGNTFQEGILTGISAEETYRRHTGPGQGFVFHGYSTTRRGQRPEIDGLRRVIDRERPVVFVLARRDLLRRATSLEIAKKSDWARKCPIQSIPRIEIEPRQLAWDIDQALAERATARQWYPGAHYLWYEDLVAHWDERIREIQRAIGVTEVLLIRPRREKTGPTAPIRKIITNYDTLQAEFAGTEYERWFELAERRDGRQQCVPRGRR